MNEDPLWEAWLLARDAEEEAMADYQKAEKQLASAQWRLSRAKGDARSAFDAYAKSQGHVLPEPTP